MPRKTKPTSDPPYQAVENQRSLEVEIYSLRDLSQRVFSLASKAKELDELIRALHALGGAYTRLASLLTTQQELASQPGPAEKALEHVLREIAKEMELDE